MKNILAILIFALLLSCIQSDQQNNLVSNTNCKKSAPFGDIKVCLPTIDGMTECYSNAKVKARADQFNYEGNSILAYYLNNKTFKQIDNLENITYDDYFQIYATDKLKGLKVGEAELNQMTEVMANNYLKENWDDIKNKFEKSYDYLSIGKPVLIENYSPVKEARAFVMLVKYVIEENEFVLVTSINMIKIKERLIWLAYYKNYDGEESIKQSKSKNNSIVLKLIAENK